MSTVQHAPHAPQVGGLARKLGRFHVTGLFWYRFHQFGVRVTPRWMISFWVTLFTWFFFFVLFRIRRAIAGNLEVALGSCGRLERQKRIYRTLSSFAWCLTERYERLSIDVTIDRTVENREAWRRATDGDRGVILVTAHVGNWEIGSALPSSEEQRPVHLVREEEKDPRAQEFIRKLLAERMGELYTTHFATDDPALGLELRDALGRGEIVALQVDRPRARGRTISVELFGKPFALPVGPMVLSRASGAPVLPVFVLRRGRLGYRVCFRDPIRVETTSSRDADVARAAKSLARSIEWAIREAPDQWFCFRSLW